MRRLCVLAVTLLACTSTTFIIETDPDGSIDTGLVDTGPDVAHDALPESSIDAAADVGPDVIAVDAGADVHDTGIPEAAYLGGNTCPVIGPCDSGFEFHSTQPDSGIAYLCGTVTPHCPTGWACEGFDMFNNYVIGKCP